MTESRVSRTRRRLSLALLAGVAMFLQAAPVHSAEGLNAAAWNPGSQWLSLRFGYAKERGRFSPNGNVGYGFGYSRMVSKRLSLGANVQHDLLGKFGGSALIAMPATIEGLWHFKWGSSFHPYAGAGVAAVYRKTYRTGADASTVQPGYSFSLGANVPIDKAHLLGLDARLGSVAGNGWEYDPVFLIRRPTNSTVSIKLNYSLTY
ncbi:MAG: hypothetical protein ABIS67_15410 [Candidatus Eisenbacteria bacterium]